jgi:replicative DNA helicase
MAENLNIGKLEYLILNFSLHDRGFWLFIMDPIRKEFFEDKNIGYVFNVFKKYFKKYNNLPDIDVVRNELKDISEDTLSGIYAEPDDSKQEYIYDKTREFIKNNMMREGLLESVNLLEKSKYDEIYHIIKNIVSYNMDVSLGVSIFDIDTRYERIKEMETDRVGTGFPSLDAVLKGGWSKKELYAVAAPPGIGKSIFLANFASNALKQDFNVVLYTLEISEERLSMRVDAILTSIPHDELVMSLDKLKKRYQLHRKTYKSNLYIKEFPTKSATTNTLRAHMEQIKLHEEFVPDLVVVDYAGLLRPTFRTGDQYDDLRTIYEDLRGMAVEFNVPVLTASQTNRKSLEDKGGTKEIITQAQVAESLGITQTLDMFMTITQSRTEKEDGTIHIYVDKHRSGESSKKFTYSIDYKTFKLEEIEL